MVMCYLAGRSIRLFTLVLLGATSPLLAQAPVKTPTPTQPDPHARRHASQISLAQQRLAAAGENPTASSLVALGDALLRGGQCEAAVAAFEKAIKRRPESEPYLWQHGIALFFVGRHHDASQLFEKHRVVNSNDVENAAWHFLCVAKDGGLSKARQVLLPAPGDRRPPMKQILPRLAGGDATEIEAAVGKVPEGSARQSARFYADLYLGLIADAEGHQDDAARYMRQAAKTSLTHYMADVARVYAETLSAPSSSTD